MKLELPDDVLEGRSLLEKYEQSKHHEERTRYFVFGIEILNDTLEDASDPKLIDIINNLKISYTRKLLNELPNLQIEEVVDWLHYVTAVIKVKDEREILYKDYPSLEKYVKVFFKLYKDAFYDIIK